MKIGTSLENVKSLFALLIICTGSAADPLAVNDDALTPLDMARNRGHVSVVRMIEVLFSPLAVHNFN